MSKPARQSGVCLGILIAWAFFNPDLLGASQDKESASARLNVAMSQPGTADPGFIVPSAFPSAVSPVRSSLDGESQFSTTKTLGSILFVLALILAIAICLKRYMPDRFGATGNKRMIQVLENVSLGEKRSLILVRIHDHNLLLANTPSSISLIKEVDLRRLCDTSAIGPLSHNPDPSSREFAVSRAGNSAAEGTSPVAFSDIMASELHSCRTSRREGQGQLFPSLGKIRGKLQRRFRHS